MDTCETCGRSCLQVPNTDCCLKPGYIIKLGRYDSTEWAVHMGWYTWGGNRPVCGWYLTNNSGGLKPLQSTDLEDIYVIRCM